MKKPTKSDISLLSRALTMARGMVSPSYVAAEAKAKPTKKNANDLNKC